MEYVKDTKVTDATPPPAPTNVRVQGNKVTWEAEADLESGLASFIVERDGRFLANVPEKGKNPFGRPVFQGLQYSDTPTQPLVPMQFTDTKADAGKRHTYRVIAVNTVGLKSKPSAKATALPSAYWPGWRGPNADGVADGRNLPVRWSKTENVRWFARLPGWGTSSPVVYGERVFVTSHLTDRDRKALLTLCFDRATGKELWRHDFGFGVDQRTHQKSNLAVNTPAVTKDAVYIAFGNADIACYTHDGKLLWVNRYMKEFGDPKMAWGYGVSPVVLDDSVLFPWNHHKGPCYVIGLDRKTGQFAWKKDRPVGTAHATPLVVEHHGRKDILIVGQNRLTAFDAGTHEELWRYGEGSGPYNGEIISSPVYADGVVFLQLWRDTKIQAIRLRGDRQPPEHVWTSAKPGPVESSLLCYRGLVYALLDNGTLVCLDGKTGREHYRQRLGAPANSSPIASEGHVYLSDNEGTTSVVQAGPEFKLLHTNRLGERISASPAVAGNDLIYRTDSHLYCVGHELEQPR
jgi:outer membrane protein assembly factor BamB